MPAPLLMARWMLSLGTPSFLAFSTAAKSRAFIAGSAPPILAAMVISRTALVLVLDFLRPVTRRFASSHWRPICLMNIAGRGEIENWFPQKEFSQPLIESATARGFELYPPCR